MGSAKPRGEDPQIPPIFADSLLLNAGMKLSIADAAKRYGRAIADPGEPLLKPVAINSASETPSANVSPNRENRADTFDTPDAP